MNPAQHIESLEEDGYDEDNMMLILYRLEQLEIENKSNHTELLERISEIDKGANDRSREITKHDFRLTQLEKKFEIQEKYLYGIIIIILTQLVTEFMALWPPH